MTVRQQLLPSMEVKGIYKSPLFSLTLTEKILPCNILLLADTPPISIHLRSHELTLPSSSSSKTAVGTFLIEGEVSPVRSDKGKVQNSAFLSHISPAILLQQLLLPSHFWLELNIHSLRERFLRG